MNWNRIVQIPKVPKPKFSQKPNTDAPSIHAIHIRESDTSQQIRHPYTPPPLFRFRIIVQFQKPAFLERCLDWVLDAHHACLLQPISCQLSQSNSIIMHLPLEKNKQSLRLPLFLFHRHRLLFYPFFPI